MSDGGKIRESGIVVNDKSKNVLVLCALNYYHKLAYMKPQTKTWLEMAENDLAFAQDIIKHKQRPFYAVHFCHQSIEKILKAIIQERTNEMPPKTHNFNLLCKHAGLKLPPDIEQSLFSLAPHYLGTRYPEDISKLYRQYTFDYAKQILERTEALFAWLKNTLKSKK